jgi:hypothetical protein
MAQDLQHKKSERLGKILTIAKRNNRVAIGSVSNTNDKC